MTRVTGRPGMSRMRLGVARALVEDRWLAGDVTVAGGRIEAVGVMPAGRSGSAAPGFVDLQVNGFAGVDFLDTDPDGHDRAGRAMAATGVTAYQPTLITSTDAAYRAALALIGEVMRAGVGASVPRMLGAHLEGPFIAVARRGAHPAELVCDPDPARVASWLALGPVSSCTLAPELPGAIEVIGTLRAAGVVVSLGHSDADAATAHAGFDAGASTVTHLFNAMRPFGHRDPGLAGVALARPDVVVQVIVDHVHVASEAVAVAWRAARGRFALVTDAIEAAGSVDGEHRLGAHRVEVRDGEVRLPDGTLAGSVLTMDGAVRNLVGLGVPVEEALAAASTVPARVIGRSDLGRLVPGATADVVVLDDGLVPVRTLVGGRQLV